MAVWEPEVERRYDVSEGTALPALADLPGVAEVDTAGEEQLEAAYFDTDRLDLAAAGVTLRRRSGGDDQGWHLKLPVAAGERHEVRLPLSRAAKTPPKPLRDTVRVHTRDRRLRQVAVLRTRRTVHRLLDSGGRVLAEVCDDAVTAPEPAPGDSGVPVAWREWMVELAAGDVDLLDGAGRLLRAAGATRASSASKLARVLGDRLPGRPAPPQPVGPDGPAALVVHARLSEQIDEMKRRDPQVRRDLPDAVHQMRVAMRRLRSALATFRPLLDRAVTEPLREELKWVSGVLGEARDIEVMHERLRRTLAGEPPELLLGGVVERVDHELADAYREAHDRSVEALASDRYFDLVDRLDALAADPPWTPAAEQPARAVLPPRMRSDWKRLRARVAAVEEADDRATRDERLHEVRKAAKRARYAAEALTRLYGADAKRFVRAAQRVQRVLGDHQDSVVMQPLLRQLGVQAHRAGENGFTYGRLHAMAQVRAADTERRFRKAWKQASRRRLRRWF